MSSELANNLGTYKRNMVFKYCSLYLPQLTALIAAVIHVLYIVFSALETGVKINQN